VLLALDTSTALVSVALHDGADVVWERASAQRMKHAEQLAPLIDAALTETGLVRQDLTAIAAGTGPGPFTGLRVGLVTARTLAAVLGLPVYGVCSLDVLAVEALDSGAVQGSFLVASDARRKEVHLAGYDADARRLSGPVVDRPERLRTDRPVVGEGARLYPDAFPHVVGPERPSAGWLARTVTDERAELTDPDPLYLRRPDAAMPGAPKRVS
jgi:tRNA threonylcarbamoyl adenosine modification protein YeaZ